MEESARAKAERPQSLAGWGKGRRRAERPGSWTGRPGRAGPRNGGSAGRLGGVRGNFLPRARSKQP